MILEVEKTNPATVYLSKWPKKSDTFKTMRGALKQIAQVLVDQKNTDPEDYPWHELRYDSVRAIPAQLKDADLAVRTINKALSALRGVLEAAWRSGALPDEEYRKIEVENVRGRSLPAGHALDERDIKALIAGVKDATHQTAALIAIMFSCGLRRVEIVRLRKEDYDPRTGEIQAFGKGDKARLVAVPPGWQPIVERWWETRPERAHLFVDENNNAMTRRVVSYTVERFCVTAKVKRFTPHDLRRSFGTMFLENGGDLATLSRQLGHASIQTTVGSYDKRSDEAARAIVAKMPSPEDEEKK